MKALCRCGLVSSLVALMIVPPALVYEEYLSSEAIRQAYFLAKEQQDRRAEFLRPYRHFLPMPKTGPQVRVIEVETPLTFVMYSIADAGHDNPTEQEDYHAQEAEQDYLSKTSRFRVHVEIDFTTTYPKSTDTIASLSGFWNDFKVHLKQDAEIPPQRVYALPTFDDYSLLGYSGATIDVDYDATMIERAEPAKIEVDTPDGQRVMTTFDLARLQ